MRIATGIAVGLGLGITALVNGQELTGRVTVVAGQGGRRMSASGLSAPVTMNATVRRVGDRIETAAAGRVAVYLASANGKPTAQAGVYLDENASAELRADRNVHIGRGVVMVQYADQGNQPLRISTPAGWARLTRGSLRVDVRADRVTFTLAGGQAAVFLGVLPDAGPGDAKPAVTLLADGENQAVIAGEKVTTAREAGAMATFVAFVRALSWARLPAASREWVRGAEAGDLVPSVSTPTEAAAVATAMGVASAVDQPTQVSPVTVAPVTSPVTQTTPSRATGAETLLRSQNAASVLVGARLQRTRIVGNPGATGGGGTIRFNTQVREPLRLSTGR